VAVIVPLFNEAQLLPRLLERLRALPVDELILVDGGSDDGSASLLADSGLRWMSSEPGRARQMNAGAARCDSDLLLFVHADTELDAAHIALLREAMADGLYVGGRFDLRLSGGSAALRLIGWFINRRSCLSGISTGDQCQFVRRQLFERIGGFPEQPLMEDIELSKRLKRIGRLACLPLPVVTSSRRWERHGLIRTVLLMWQLRLLYWLGVSPQRLARRYRLAR